MSRSRKPTALLVFGENDNDREVLCQLVPVSYTHLTLPTSDLV